MHSHAFLSMSKLRNESADWPHLKVDVAIFIHVKGTEDVVAKFLCVAAREKHLVHVDEFVRSEAAVRTVLLHKRKTN